MRISDWSSDVCSSDRIAGRDRVDLHAFRRPFVREQLGESANARFRRGIARHANAALKGEHRGNVDDLAAAARDHMQIGRASCRERVCQYVSISGVAVSLKKKSTKNII